LGVDVAQAADIRKWICQYGPIVCNLKITPKFATFGWVPRDKGAVFRENYYGTTPTDQQLAPDHTVIIVGWSKPLNAWRIVNSTSAWGDKGFGWVGVGVNKIGSCAYCIVPR